ncbi:MAG: hypothetical protein ACXAC7_00365 [Candidatus Hodarchaeales archaeon]
MNQKMRDDILYYCNILLSILVLLPTVISATIFTFWFTDFINGFWSMWGDNDLLIIAFFCMIPYILYVIFVMPYGKMLTEERKKRKSDYYIDISSLERIDKEI